MGPNQVSGNSELGHSINALNEKSRHNDGLIKGAG
jgi:hypothetical protein